MKRQSKAHRGALEIDTQRVFEAVRGPGIDTRTWIETGICEGDAYSESQDGGGVLWFVDASLQPSGNVVTCRIGCAVRAGDGLGILSPLKDGDEVQVQLDDGDPNNGPVAFARLNGPLALPPAGWNNDSTVIVSDVPIQLVASDVFIGSPVSPQNPAAVQSSQTPSPDAMLLGTAFSNANGTLLTGIDAVMIALSVFLASLSASTDPALITAAGILATAMSTAGWSATGVGDPVAVFKQAVILSQSAKVGK
jgi:hypothetical protein